MFQTLWSKVWIFIIVPFPSPGTLPISAPFWTFQCRSDLGITFFKRHHNSMWCWWTHRPDAVITVHLRRKREPGPGVPLHILLNWTALWERGLWTDHHHQDMATVVLISSLVLVVLQVWVYEESEMRNNDPWDVFTLTIPANITLAH